MADDVDRLREMPPLRLLLAHYAALGNPDRLIWQDRLGDLEGLTARELTRLHGELLAYAWIEQNTGITPAGTGSAPGCYRITHAGIRSLRQAAVEMEVA